MQHCNVGTYDFHVAAATQVIVHLKLKKKKNALASFALTRNDGPVQAGSMQAVGCKSLILPFNLHSGDLGDQRTSCNEPHLTNVARLIPPLRLRVDLT